MAEQAPEKGEHAAVGTEICDDPPAPTVVNPNAIRVLSLGAGVQSTALLLMSLYGDLPPIDVAIFADTGWEPKAVYEHLLKLETEAALHGVEVRKVTAGNIHDDHVDPQGAHLFIRKPRKRPEWEGRQRTFVPFYVVGEKGDGITFRTCTKTYKIEPVERELRNILGLKYRARWPLTHEIDQVMGISKDEEIRCRTSRRPAIRNVYPLVEMGLTRDDCHRWMADHGWTAPRSACIGCPFHRNDEWRRLRDEAPEEFAQAVDFDHTMRRAHAAGRLPIEGVPYIHDQRVPLDEADLDEPEDLQGSLFDGWNAECEGMCGL